MTRPPYSPLASRIAELIGDEVACNLFRKMGGDRVYMPVGVDKRAESYNRLVEAIGPDHAEVLREWSEGCTLEVPKARAAERLIRNIQIIRAYSNGVPVHEICRDFGIGRRAVFYILKTPIPMEPEEGQ